MAISFIAAGTVATGSNPTVSYPAGDIEGDLLVLITTGGATPTTPTGWTQRYAQGAGRFITILTRYVQGGEGNSVALTTASGSTKAVMLCYRGAGSYDVVGTVATGSSTTATTNSQNTTYANDFVLSIFARTTTASTFTNPAGTNTRVNSSSTSGVNGLLIADELQAAAGATTARSTTLSVSGAWAAINISFVETRTLYWVGGTGTWSATGTGNWANSSGGSGVGILPPVQNETAIIDSSSGTGTITCTTGVCGDLSVTASQAIILGAASSTLSVFGTLSFPSGGSFSANTNANTITLAAGSAKTVTTNGKSFSSLTFNGVGGNWTLPSALTATGTVTLTNGTVTLSTNTTTLTCAAFSSDNSNTRSIAFGTGQIILTGNNTTVFNVASSSNLSTSGTVKFVSTPTTYSGTRTFLLPTASAVYTIGPATSNQISFGNTGGDSVAISATLTALDFTGYLGTWAQGANTLSITTGNLTLSAGMSTTASTGVITFPATSGTQIVTSAGKTINPVTKSGVGGTLRLADTMTLATTGTFTLTSGALDLGTNNATLSCGLFSSDNANTRSIAFGTSGNITTRGSGTVFTTATVTGLTYTGTPTVNISNNSSNSTTVTAHTTGGTEANAFNFNFTTGTYSLTLTTGSVVEDVNFTGFAGTWSPSTATCTFYGSLTLVSGMTFTTGSGLWTWANTSGTAIITSASKTLGPITQSGAGGTVRLASGTTTLGVTRTYTLTAGTLDVGTNTSTLSCGLFSSNNSNTRSIIFGTGNITTTASGTVWTTATATNLTYTGTPTVNISNNSATATTVTAGTTGGASTNAFNFNFTIGNYTLTLTANSRVRNLDFTGFTGSYTQDLTTIYGDLTVSSGMTYDDTTDDFTFAATSGVQLITSSGKTIGSVTQSSGGTVRLVTSPTRIGFYTLTAGTLDLATNTASLRTNTFTSSTSSVRSIQFGTASIDLFGFPFIPLIWNTANATNLTVTGTPTVNILYSGSQATTVNANTSGGSENNAFNFNFTAGTYALTLPTSSVVRSLNFTGFTGSWAPATATATIFGNITLVAGMTYTTPTGLWTLAATSGTQTITSGGKTLGPVTQSGVGGTVALGSAFVSNATYTLTNGTFNASNQNFTTSIFSSNNSNVRTLTMGSGTWTLSGTGTVWDLATTSNLTFNKDTANIVLSNTTTTARTFAGGSLTYNDLTIGGATGTSTLTFTGNNTFNTLASTKTVAHTITLPASGTTTVANWTITGTSGNVVTLNSSTPGTQSTLTKTGGGQITGINYLSISDSAATPSSTWYAGANSIDSGGNTGWIFGLPSDGNFFLLF